MATLFYSFELLVKPLHLYGRERPDVYVSEGEMKHASVRVKEAGRKSKKQAKKNNHFEF